MIDGTPSDKIFTFERVTSQSGIHTGNLVGKLISPLKHALLPDADFIGWMKLSYFVCSFNPSLISLLFRTLSSKRSMLLNMSDFSSRMWLLARSGSMTHKFVAV